MHVPCPGVAGEHPKPDDSERDTDGRPGSWDVSAQPLRRCAQQVRSRVAEGPAWIYDGGAGATVIIEMVLAGLSFTLPDAAAGWKAAEAPARYDSKTIFQYIDGHGEVYLAYGMVACFAQRYSGPTDEGDVVLDIFEMDSPAAAYGVFTHSRDGDPVVVGQEGTLAFGTLLFWKGRYFVSVYADDESERAKEAVMALGRAVAGAIVETGEIPALVELLPPAGLEARSIVWMRDPHVLDAHARLGKGNSLGVGRAAPAVLARYTRESETAELLLVAYPDQASAGSAADDFSERFLDAGRPARRENGWFAAGVRTGDAHLHAFVLRASSRQAAEGLLADVTKGAEP